MKIIVDAFGGDNAPEAIIEGAAAAVKELSVEIILTGKKDIIEKVAREKNISLQNIEIEDCPEVIEMCDDPTDVLKKKKDSSMSVGLRMLSEGKGDAFVSAGSTAALVVGATLIVKRLKGIKRPALATVIPCEKKGSLLLDVGANAVCRPQMLLQFAVMGSVYMNKIYGIENPNVGLVNIGAERTKGTELQLETYELLEKSNLNFSGNIEPRDIPSSDCDVIVADGFTGNVILKLTEGLAKTFSKKIKAIFKKNIFTKMATIPLLSGIKDFKKSMDYSEHGGAPLLGTLKPVIKAHGSSNSKAIKNAIRQAAKCVESEMIEKFREGITALPEMKEDNQ